MLNFGDLIFQCLYFYFEITNQLFFNIRYPIKVRVSDEVEDAVFVLFDKESTSLIGKKCGDMLDALRKSDPSSVVSSQILSLIGKTFIFKVEIKINGNPMFEPSYSVKRVCTDAHITFVVYELELEFSDYIQL